jgi:hypothetical protein
VKLRVAVACAQSMHRPRGMDKIDAFVDCAAATTTRQQFALDIVNSDQSTSSLRNYLSPTERYRVHSSRGLLFHRT